MKFSTQCLVTVALWGFSLMAPAFLVAESPPAVGCEEAVALLKAQNDKLTGDLRRIQREIAALRADLDKPGIDDVFSGIGYILGLFGTAAFVASRRRKE